MMMITITVWLNSALVMGSTYDDAATRAAAIRHRTRAEYPSHIKRSISTFWLCEASAYKVRASEAAKFGDLLRQGE